MGGDYAEWTCVPQDRLVMVPAELSLEQAAAVLLQGTTAHVLTHQVYAVRPGEWVLVHAAASGVGALLAQMAKDLGAPVIGTTSVAQKAALVRQAGADEVIVSTEQDLVTTVHTITAGQGVQVVYDGVGGALFEPSLNVLQARGYLVEFGMAGGRPPLLDVSRLAGITGGPNKVSLFVTWASAGDYLTPADALRTCAAAVFQMVMDGRLRQQVAGVFPLAEAAHAHQLLENRTANGKLLLQTL
jgi:NADPH2:quinone reductase